MLEDVKKHASGGVPPSKSSRRESFAARATRPLLATVAAVSAVAALAPAVAFAAPPADKQIQLLAHGKYIVERVGMCADCHSPKGPDGKPIAGEELHGGPLPMSPLHPVPGWADRSVKIAGLPDGYTEAQLATFLETGRTPSGGTASPPMPSYRLNASDARAAAAYLHSLN